MADTTQNEVPATPLVPTADTGPPAHTGRAGVHIREMELTDIAPIYALGETLFTPDRWPVLYRMWDEYELATLFTTDGETCLVAEQSGRLAGFALGQVIDKPRSSWRYGYLLWIGVDPKIDRRGVGTQLARELLRRFSEHGARMILADTAADNTEALGFLAKIGFGRPQQHVYLSMNLSRQPAARNGGAANGVRRAVGSSRIPRRGSR